MEGLCGTGSFSHKNGKGATWGHHGAYSKLAQESPAADLAAAAAAAPAPAPDAAGDAGGDGADSPTGRRPGYKQQLDPGRQMQMLGGPSQAKKWEDLYN